MSIRLLQVLLMIVRRILTNDKTKGLVQIAFEWPKGTFGWKLELIQQLELLLPHTAEFDGSAYGLVDQHGELLMQPWE
eukprot:8059583-Heterocapsa_arctica.AAC.1